MVLTVAWKASFLGKRAFSVFIALVLVLVLVLVLLLSFVFVFPVDVADCCCLLLTLLLLWLLLSVSLSLWLCLLLWLWLWLWFFFFFFISSSSSFLLILILIIVPIDLIVLLVLVLVLFLVVVVVADGRAQTLLSHIFMACQIAMNEALQFTGNILATTLWQFSQWQCMRQWRLGYFEAWSSQGLRQKQTTDFAQLCNTPSKMLAYSANAGIHSSLEWHWYQSVCNLHLKDYQNMTMGYVELHGSIVACLKSSNSDLPSDVFSSTEVHLTVGT